MRNEKIHSVLTLLNQRKEQQKAIEAKCEEIEVKKREIRKMEKEYREMVKAKIKINQIAKELGLSESYVYDISHMY